MSVVLPPINPQPLPPSPPSRRGRLFMLWLTIAVVASFTVGYWAGEERGFKQAFGRGEVKGKDETPPAYLSQDVDFKLFWDVWKMLQDEYVARPIPDTKLFYGALQGLVAGVGDPYTVFLDPETAKKFNDELAGSFEGIGAEIGLRNNQIVIIAPLEGTPAASAGLKPGDVVLSIDGLDTAGMSLDAAVSTIRGEKGTTVILMVVRDNGKPFEIRIVRATIDIKSVEFSLKVNPSSGAKVAYLKISHFNDDTAQDFTRAVEEILAKQPQGIILDLRNNPGGYLETAVAVASSWINDGVVVIEQAHGGEERTEYPAHGSSPLQNFKTVVLVNVGSASASEIVAGALQDYGLATIVGQKTFGKGSVQKLETLRDGSALKVTFAEWLTPKGRALNEVGITPDVVVDVDRNTLTEGQDPELERAFELIR